VRFILAWIDHRFRGPTRGLGLSGIGAVPAAASAPRHRIRAARRAEAPVIAGLLEALGYPQSVAGVRARLDVWAGRDDCAVLVGDVGAQAAGVVALHACPHFERPGRWARITALVVAEPHGAAALAGRSSRRPTPR
jgi:hypothetical protein